MITFRLDRTLYNLCILLTLLCINLLWLWICSNLYRWLLLCWSENPLLIWMISSIHILITLQSLMCIIILLLHCLSITIANFSNFYIVLILSLRKVQWNSYRLTLLMSFLYILWIFVYLHY